MADAMKVEVVAADRRIFEGESINVIVRTTEGDIGILPDHESVLATLVPCAATIVTTDGRQEIVAIEGGFLSVRPGQVSLISPYAKLLSEISAEEAQRDVDELERKIDLGEASIDDMHRFHLARAQLKAVEKSKESR